MLEAHTCTHHRCGVSGVDIGAVEGIGVGVAQAVIIESGTDMSQFPKEGNCCF
jgi:hypothetical protein